ncbi:MAG: DUF362 domain-containing protein [Candidatus Latescibacteria bacterium]|jgi:uncharacterized protein (DUF362 family)|nr:DUF362 domain-containing protein [Candidatus Latescibacterota bacterium]
MNRRDFLRIGTGALASNLLSIGRVHGAPIEPSVFEVEGRTADAMAALFAAVGGVDSLVEKDLSRATVLIKPNLCLPHAEASGTTTSPQAVDALCSFLASKGAKRIVIADHTLKSNRFDKIELNAVVAEYPNARLLLANQQRLYEPLDVDGRVLKQIELLKVVRRADLFINLATAKHHSATRVSLAIKNLMGVIWDRTTFHTRLDLSQAIADLATAVRPSLNIVDASRVLLSGGPTGPGTVVRENRLFAGLDILALDAVVASRYGFGGRRLPPEQIEHLKASHKNGVGEIDTRKIRVEKVEA